ncbi:hypothetical protein [Nocardia asiatica]|uniref:hypothetical protein n=1 Tax=Nocardia asiatica TaxID=209252 RepID=UPI002453B4D8|nr:hypothetical protein [Nocardia asiatica]
MVAVVMGAFGTVGGAGTVYTALAGGTLGGVSLLINNRARDARNLAVTIAMVNEIEDPQLRDQTRARIALEAAKVQTEQEPSRDLTA